MTELSRFKRYKENPTIESRNELVEENLYMVDILIRKYLNKGVDYDDLYQVGAMALMQAVERFDPSRGFEFSSFATPTILGEIRKYFRDKQWSLKVPRRLKETAAKVQEVKESLGGELSRAPTIAEIAERSGFTEEQVIEAMEGSQAYGTYSLDKTFEEAGDNGESPFLERYTGFEDKGFVQVENDEIIGRVLETLSERDRYIFRERFLEDRSQADIAGSLGVSQMTISRAERSIVNKFREELNR